MTELKEALKGFTDLPIAAVSFTFGLILHKRNKQQSLLFFLVSFSAVIGGIVHIFSFSEFVKNIIWTFLYLLLFESIRRFSFVLYSYITKKKINNKLFYLFEVFLYILTLFFLFAIGKYDMLILIIFSAVCLYLPLKGVFISKNVPKSVYLLFITLIIPVLLQTFSAYIPYAVVYEHIFITLDLFIVYKMAINN